MTKMHNLRFSIVIASVIALALSCETATAGSFVYDVVPVTLTDIDSGDQYSVSGTITTNCINCILTEANITEYSVDVAGPFSFTFTETNPGQSLIVNNVMASPTELFIAVPGNLSDTLSLDAADNSNPDCTSCVQSLIWAGGDQALTLYIYGDGDDLDPFVVADFTSDSTNLIATRIPEPSSALLLVLALSCVSLLRARQR